MAELATCGLPSILVPYPYSLDDDQGHNAKVLTDVGAAVLVLDADATADVVGPLLEAWFADPDGPAAAWPRRRTAPVTRTRRRRLRSGSSTSPRSVSLDMAVPRTFLLKPSDSLGTAMGRVASNGEGFAAVVDEDSKLLGTFCDADGRRAMLRGVALDAPVGEVMARSTTTHRHGCPGGSSSKHGVVTDVVTEPRPPVDVAVMAGGKGTRLRSITGPLPKPLLEHRRHDDHRTDPRATSPPPASSDAWVSRQLQGGAVPAPDR